MKLMQLYYFRTACRQGSITRAAGQLHISQPSVSAAIRELEAEFGYALLARQGKRFALTPEGAVFLKEADRLLSHAENFETAMKQLTQGPRQIVLGVPPMIGSLLLPKIYAGFRGKKIPFRLSIVETGRQELLRQLLGSNELDMAFLPHDRPLDTRCHSVPITELETVCCLAPDHPLAGRATLSPAELSGESLVLFKDSFFQTERIVGLFQSEGIAPRVLLQTDQLSTIRKLVTCNIAVGFLFRQISEPFRDIVSIPLAAPMKAKVSLAWRSTDYLPREQADFIEYIRTISVP